MTIDDDDARFGIGDLRCAECHALYRRGPHSLRFKTCLCPANKAYIWDARRGVRVEQGGDVSTGPS